MKVLFYEPFGDGGIAHYTYNLARALAANGHRAVVFTNSRCEFGDHGSLAYAPRMFLLTNALMRVVPWLERESAVPSLIRRAAKLCEYPLYIAWFLALSLRGGFDAVHFQTVNQVETLLLIPLRLARRRIVFTVHNVKPRHREFRFFDLPLYRIMYGLCDGIIIHTRSGREELGRYFKVPSGKVSVIPHGDYKFFVPESPLPSGRAKEALGIEAGRPTLLFFGAIRPNKGLDLLLEALPRIVLRVPDALLLIVGEPSEDYARHRRAIERAGMSGNVFEQLSYVANEDVHRYLCATDVVALPYNEITQSGVLQVAYAFGKPVVATDLPGFREAVEDGGNGYLVPGKDPEAFAEGVSRILGDPDLTERMGRRSRELADSRFSWRDIALRTVEVYSRVAERLPAGGGEVLP